MQTVATNEVVTIAKRVYKEGYFKSWYWNTVIEINPATSTMVLIKMKDTDWNGLNKEDVIELGNLFLELANNMESY